jgi:hypothetical protein
MLQNVIAKILDKLKEKEANFKEIFHELIKMTEKKYKKFIQ